MKVCIPIAKDKGLESIPFAHFGSAPLFLIADTESGTAAVIENGNSGHVHGGCSPIAALQGHNPDAVIVGGIGQGAVMKLRALGIEVFIAGPGNAANQIALLADGRLERVDASAACAGHGHGHEHTHEHAHGHGHGQH